MLNELFTSGLVAVTDDILTLVCTFGMMLYLSPELTLAYLTVVPSVLIVSVISRRRAHCSFRDMHTAVAKLASFLQEIFVGITEVQRFNHERRTQQDFDAINKKYCQANYRSVRVHAVFFPVAVWLNLLGFALLVALGGREGAGVEDTVSLGVLSAFLQYGTHAFRPIQELAERDVKS